MRTNKLSASEPCRTNTKPAAPFDRAGTLLGLARLITATNKLIWTGVALVLLAALGRHLAPTSIVASAPAPLVRQDVVSCLSAELKQRLDGEVRKALDEARRTVEQHVEIELTRLQGEMMNRVDANFLDWHLGYFRQQALGLKGLWRSLSYKVGFDDHTAEERLMEELQTELASRVLMPEVTDQVIRRLSVTSLELYITRVQSLVSKIPEIHGIEPVQWELYLNDLGRISARTEGNREQPIGLKVLVGTCAPATFLAARSLTAVGGELLGTVSARFAGSATASIATRTGASVAGRAGGKLLGPIVGVAILLWDLYDHRSTVAQARPLLREQIAQYLNGMRRDLATNRQSGVLAPVFELEIQIVEQLTE